MWVVLNRRKIGTILLSTGAGLSCAAVAGRAPPAPVVTAFATVASRQVRLSGAVLGPDGRCVQNGGGPTVSEPWR